MVTVSTSSSSLAAFLWQQSHRFVLASAWIPGTNAAGGDERFLSCFLPQRVPRHYSFSRQDGDSSLQLAREHLSCSARPGLGGAAGPDPVAGKQTCLIVFLFCPYSVFLPLICRNNAVFVMVTSESLYKLFMFQGAKWGAVTEERRDPVGFITLFR